VKVLAVIFFGVMPFLAQRVIDFYRVAAAAGVVLTPTDTVATSSTGTSNPITFTGVATGAAATGRISVVTIVHRNGRDVPTGVTINGVTATMATQTSISVATMYNSIWYAANPTGTTATVSISYAASTSLGLAMTMWSITGASATAYDGEGNDNTGVTSISLTGLTVPPGGVAVFGGQDGEQTGGGVWTNVTPYQDVNIGNSRGCSGYTTTAGTPTYTYTSIMGTSGPFAIVGASWGP
jgi:hypothetical protein